MLIPKLSICIATFKRGRFIGETLDSILMQLQPGVEIVVVDGASPDDTPEVMERYAASHPEIRYFREAENSGVDADFDKAVSYAKGEYCWLMTDDDLLRPRAVAAVLSALGGDDDLIIVNSEVRSVDLSELFEKRRLVFDEDKVYRADNREAFFTETAAYLFYWMCGNQTCMLDGKRTSCLLWLLVRPCWDNLSESAFNEYSGNRRTTDHHSLWQCDVDFAKLRGLDVQVAWSDLVVP